MCLVSLMTFVVVYLVPSMNLSVTVFVTIFSLSTIGFTTVLFILCTTFPVLWPTVVTTWPGVLTTVLVVWVTTFPGVPKTLTPCLYSTSAGIVDKTFLTFCSLLNFSWERFEIKWSPTGTNLSYLISLWTV